MEIEVDSTDVIKLIMQFLKENNLEKTLDVMQQETKVSLNTVNNLNELCTNIQHGS